MTWPIMHHNQRNANRLKTLSSLEIRVISASCSSWAFWRSFACALEWSNSCMVGSFTRLGRLGASKGFCTHVWSCMILYDLVWCCMIMHLQKRSAKQCDWAVIDAAIVENCWPAGNLFLGIRTVPKSAIERPIAICQCSHVTHWKQPDCP